MKERRLFGLPEKDFLEDYYDLIVKGRLREAYLEFLINKGLKAGKDVWIHPTALIRRPELVAVGNHVAIDDYTVISTQLKIGDYVHIAPHCSIIGGPNALLVMEDFSFIATGSRIIGSSEDYVGGTGLIGPTVPKWMHAKVKTGPIVFKRYSGLGANVVVLPGVTIGEGAVVGAGAVVNHDVEPWTVNVGIPAKPVKERPREKILSYVEELEKSGRQG